MKHLLIFIFCFECTILLGQTVADNFKLFDHSVAFIENKGQIIDQYNRPNPSVKYLYIGSSLQVQIRDNGYSYELKKELRREKIPQGEGFRNRTLPDHITYGINRVDIDFDGANSNVYWEASEPKEGYVNFYTTGTPEEGIQNVHSYRHLTAHDVWNNIDVEFLVSEFGDQPVKYNVVIKPGGNPTDVRLRIAGAIQTSISTNGGLVLETEFGELEETIPLSYYELSETTSREVVEVRFRKIANGIFGFDVPKGFPWNDRALVIDPNPDRLWGTYYGGSGDDYANGVSADATGNIYLVGSTTSSSNIATTGSHQSTIASFADGFMVKFNSTGVRQWATYHGGNGNDFIFEVVLDGQGNAINYGVTGSTTNVTTTGAHQTTHGNGNGENDAWVSKFNASGVRQWATYYGGNGREEWSYALALDASNNIYIAGQTNSTNNITSSGAFQVNLSGVSDGFVAKFNNSGVRQWGTYYGGSGSDGFYDIAVDANANVFVTGSTTSNNNVATNGVHQNIFGGSDDALVLKFNTTGSRIWGTYYGGPNSDLSYAITVDNDGNVVVGGLTHSSSGISSPCAHLSNPLGPISFFGEGYLTKFNGSNGTTFWGTYYGGGTSIEGLASDNSNNIYITGTTSQSDLATANAYQSTLLGSDIFIGKMNGAGVQQFFSYYGGNGSINETAYDIKILPAGEFLIAGFTNSTNNIASSGSYQSSLGGSIDAFLVKFKDNSPIVSITELTASISDFTPSCIGQSNGTATVTAVGSGLFSYLWSNGQTGATAVNLDGGTYTVTVTSNMSNCTAIASATILSYPPVTSGFSFVENGLEVTFTNNSTNGTSFEWIFGDGQSSTHQNISHFYDTADTYNVCLITDGLCRSDTICQDISIPTDFCWHFQTPQPQIGLYYDVFFINHQTGWVVGNNGMILKTIDGGNSWQAQTSITQELLSGVFFVDLQTGWVVGSQGTILKTIDGGTTWQVQSSGTLKLLKSVYFYDSQIGWVVGGNGTILKTNDGGVTWHIQTSNTTNELYGICFTNSQTGWVVGGNSILKTTDGGISWQSQNSNNGYGLWGVNFVNSQIGWVVGLDRTILKTIDGGVTWNSQIPIRSAFHLYDVFFIDSLSGWASGNGKIYYTSDGGIKWRLQVQLNGFFYGIHFLDNQTGWVVGSSQIVKYGIVPKPSVQDVILCKEALTGQLSAQGSNLLWYSTPTGGTGSLIAPTPNTSDLGSTTYYVSQSPVGLGDCVESERASITVTITAPSITVITTNSCNNNGSAMVILSGGTAPYSYIWSSGQSTSEITNLLPGNYSVTVTDVNGCSESKEVTVLGGVAPSVSINNLILPCEDQSNGNLNVNVSGGVAPYFYLWSNGQTGATAINLNTGIYTVTVTDNNGCTSTLAAIVSALEAPIAGISNTIMPCPGLSNGSATVIVSGGVLPYNYLWSNGQTGATAINLNAGAYTVTVAGNNGCTTTATAIISTSQAPIVGISNITSPCTGQSSGSATVTANGGMSPYTYLWSNGQTGASAINLSSGTYTVTIADNNGCTSTATAIIDTSDAPITGISNTTSPCIGQSNGNATVTVNGGISPYTYLWSNGQTSQMAINLAADTYIVTVTGNNSCTSTSTAILIGISPFSILLQTDLETSGSTCQSTANTISGISPFMFDWSNGQTGQTANNLSSGQFSVTVTDATGCTSVQTGSCTPVRTKEIIGLEYFLVKPNPANTNLSIIIMLNHHDKLKIRLYNSIGQTLFESSSQNNIIEENVDVSNYPTGCYFLSVSTQTGVISEVITIMR